MPSTAIKQCNVTYGGIKGTGVLDPAVEVTIGAIATGVGLGGAYSVVRALVEGTASAGDDSVASVGLPSGVTKWACIGSCAVLSVICSEPPVSPSPWLGRPSP